MTLIEGFITNDKDKVLTNAEILYYDDKVFYVLNLTDINDLTKIDYLVESPFSMEEKFSMISSYCEKYLDKLEPITSEHPIFQKDSTRMKSFLREAKINEIIY